MTEKMRAALFMIALAVLPAAPGFALDLSIKDFAVNGSISEDGCPQLDFGLLCEAYGKEPAEMVAYFFDGETGEPYPAAPGGDHPYITENGYLGADAGSIPAYSRKTRVRESFSVPLWAMDLNGGAHEMKVLLYLKERLNAFKEKLDYIGMMKFDVKLPDGFKKFRDMEERMIRINIPTVRERLPDPPAIRMDGLGAWNAFTALPVPRVTTFNNQGATIQAGEGSGLPPVNLRSVSTTIFVPNRGGVNLGGNAEWRHEGSADDWRELYDRLGVQRGVLLPNSRTRLANGTGAPRSQIVLQPEILEIGGRNVDVEVGVDEVRAFSRVPQISDIPEIGSLFLRGVNVREDRILLIFVRPQLSVRPDER